MTRHRSRYLWAAMNDGSRKPAEATRWMKTWGWAAGWPLAWSTDDWRQNSSDNRRSRTTASSLARIRCRARTRALRARIRQSPHFLVWVSKFSILRPFADKSGHSAQVSGSGTGSGSVSDSGMTGWRYGREWFPGLGTGKCQPGGTFGLFIVSRYSSRSENPRATPRHSRRNGNPEPLLCVMKVVLRETCWVRCRRPPAEYLLP